MISIPLREFCASISPSRLIGYRDYLKIASLTDRFIKLGTINQKTIVVKKNTGSSHKNRFMMNISAITEKILAA